MRPLFPVSPAAVLALMALTACVTGVDPIEATSETLDPSQVRMLPDNPLQAPQPARNLAVRR